MSGPVMRTRARPPRVHAKVPFISSPAVSFFKPMPSSLRSTMVMVPIAIAKPRMCRISHTGNAHSFVFSGLFDTSYAKKSAIRYFHLVFYREAPDVVRRRNSLRRTNWKPMITDVTQSEVPPSISVKTTMSQAGR